MAILTVGPTSTYSSIAAAMLAAAPGDIVSLESGYINETATITQNNITVTGDTTSTSIVLQLSSGIATFTLAGDAPIAIIDGADDNAIVGNAGDNDITVASGVDAVDGGAGTDRLIVDYRLATGVVNGDSTTNFTEVGGGGRSVTITGGTIENFTILTGGQADTITANDGDNFISVSDGANTVTAGNGNNTVTGGSGADTFTVGDGNNTIDAGDGFNTIVAGQGGNIITGGNGTNVLTSGAGDDIITSGNGAATIVAGGNDDLITVRSGTANVDAGQANDRLVVDYGALVTNITGGTTSGNLASGYAGLIQDSAGNSVNFTEVENLTVIAGTGDDLITTGGGADFLGGNDGNDTFRSGDGDDQLSGGAENDSLDGGAGFDAAYFSGARTDYTITYLDGTVIIGGATSPQDNPVLVVDNRAGSPDGTDTLTGIEFASFAINSPPFGTVNIAGTAEEDQTLTASNTLIDPDGMGAVTYQWQANGADITGATNDTLVLDQALVGSTITVVASYSDLEDTPESVESAPTAAVTALPLYQYTLTASGTAGQTKAMVYEGPVDYLAYEYAGSSAGEAVLGTQFNDFVHLGGSDDAANGGAGDDVVDGGTGSSFLSGGDGRDVFFLDGRSGETTWSTITDWQSGEELALWGWVQGVSKATWLEDAGTDGYRGATLHADRDGNGAIDTSVTWSGLTMAALPAPTEQDNLLWFA